MQIKRFQFGGTVAGFIVGVLVGLGGALAVAVYVTKVPVPFVDRVISRKASQDEAEAERNKNWNPNAALGGKPAKLATPPETVAPAVDPTSVDDKTPKKVKAVETPKPESETTVPVAPKEAKSDEPKGKTYSSDPLGDLVQSKGQGKVVTTAPVEPKKATAATSAEPFTYFVQVGAFRTPEDAQTQRAKLALMGLDAKVTEREQAGRTVYRVRLGPYEQLSDAERMKDNLAPSGLDTALVRVQR